MPTKAAPPLPLSLFPQCVGCPRRIAAAHSQHSRNCCCTIRWGPAERRNWCALRMDASTGACQSECAEFIGNYKNSLFLLNKVVHMFKKQLFSFSCLATTQCITINWPAANGNFLLFFDTQKFCYARCVLPNSWRLVKRGCLQCKTFANLHISNSSGFIVPIHNKIISVVRTDERILSISEHKTLVGVVGIGNI